MNVKYVGSWKNDDKETCYLIIWKIIKMILEARKSSEYKKNLKKREREKEKNKVVIQSKKSVLKNPGHL